MISESTSALLEIIEGKNPDESNLTLSKKYLIWIPVAKN